MALSRAEAVALDAADPLRAFRDRFVNDDPARIYLDGNSLGRLPVATRDRLTALVAEWGERLVSGWHEWIDAPARVGDLLAADVLGARDGAIVTDRGNFPTDRYVLAGLAARHGRELRLTATREEAAAEAGAA